MTNKTALKKLDKVYCLIKHGWCKGILSKEIKGKKCYCLDGALRESCGNLSSSLYKNYTSYVELYNKFTELTNIFSVIGWNDEKSRKKSEVLAKIRLAQEKLKNAKD